MSLCSQVACALLQRLLYVDFPLILRKLKEWAVQSSVANVTHAQGTLDPADGNWAVFRIEMSELKGFGLEYQCVRDVPQQPYSDSSTPPEEHIARQVRHNFWDW